jgi:hypothetical protein
MDNVLPAKLNIKYFDKTREYDIAEQSESRINTDAVNVVDRELPIVLTADEAKQKAVSLLYLQWLERKDLAFVLPPTYQQIEPADIITVQGENGTYESRLTSVNYLPDGRIECKAKLNTAAVYTQTAQGEEGTSTGAGIVILSDTVIVPLDIPLMVDDQDTAGFPIAIAGESSGWPGGVVFRSMDGGSTYVDTVSKASPGTLMGYATNALTANGGTVIDFASTLNVTMIYGELSSVTQLQMFNGSNWFAYGNDGRWEIIAAQNCVLQLDGTYILSDLLRGQRGTEWATGLHSVFDKLIGLTEASLSFLSVNSATIGTDYLYRGVTSGAIFQSAEDQAFGYDAVNLECLSPVHLTGSRHPTTRDWTLSWTRRSRYDQWRDYVDTPLGEATESYTVQIYSSSTYATLKRTISVTAQTASYTSAQQVTDFGTNQATLYCKIYQNSATVGAGYALTQAITRG